MTRPYPDTIFHRAIGWALEKTLCRMVGLAIRYKGYWVP